MYGYVKFDDFGKKFCRLLSMFILLRKWIVRPKGAMIRSLIPKEIIMGSIIIYSSYAEDLIIGTPGSISGSA